MLLAKHRGHEGRDGRIPDQERIEEGVSGLCVCVAPSHLPPRGGRRSEGNVLRHQAGLLCTGAQVVHCTRDK